MAGSAGRRSLAHLDVAVMLWLIAVGVSAQRWQERARAAGMPPAA
jgi:hypothetical protein